MAPEATAITASNLHRLQKLQLKRTFMAARRRTAINIGSVGELWDDQRGLISPNPGNVSSLADIIRSSAGGHVTPI
jgi:hypothetical protein